MEANSKDIFDEFFTPGFMGRTQPEKESPYPVSEKLKILHNDNCIMIQKDLSLHNDLWGDDFINTTLNEKFNVEIIPKDESQTNSFVTEIISRWFRVNEDNSETGIALSVENEELINYINFLEASQKKE